MNWLFSKRHSHYNLACLLLTTTLFMHMHFFWGLIVFALGSFTSALWEEKIERTEETQKKLKDHLWQQYAKDGLKIDAIKEHRKVYGTTLRDAKDAVEAYQQTIRNTNGDY